MNNPESKKDDHELAATSNENEGGLTEQQKTFAAVVGDALAERWRSQTVPQVIESESALSSEVDRLPKE